MPNRTILIADDEPHLVHIVAYNLRKNGTIVHIATNGDECVEMASRLLPDLIVSDYQMPHLDGLQACILLRQQLSTSKIPVIMLTARGHRLADEEIAKTGIKAVLPKPFSARQLLAMVEQLLVNKDANGAAA